MSSILDPIWNLLQYIWAHGGELWVSALSILLAGFIAWIVLSILATFINRAKVTLGRIPERVTGKTCDGCHGKGTVNCPLCKGSGTTSRTVEKEAKCKRCTGSGQVDATCDNCGGRRRLVRQALFNAVGVSANSRWTLIPLGWWEYVTVRVTNVDTFDANYDVQVTLADVNRSTQTAGILIERGRAQEVTLRFKISSGQTLDAQFNVIGQQISENCSRCGAKGTIRVQCPDCKGSGTVKEPATVEETCTQCAGKTVIQCTTCGGEGRVFPKVFS